jgi:hypothetical protein
MRKINKKKSNVHDEALAAPGSLPLSGGRYDLTFSFFGSISASIFSK